MKCRVTHIQQPYSGEFNERIYDIQSCWNSSDWTWIKFEENNDVWCGEFRGKYRGVAISDKIEIVVVLTSDYMYVLDLLSKDIIDYRRQPMYLEITTTPFEDILLTDSYGLEIFTDKSISNLKTIALPINGSYISFIEYCGDILKMTYEDNFNWQNRVEISFDCSLLEFL